MRLAVLAVMVTVTASASARSLRAHIDLDGEWNTPLGVCVLPGTTDQSRLGALTSDTTDTSKLTRLYPYQGKLRYERDIIIPPKLAGKTLLLTMERTKPSTLSIDGRLIGHQSHIYAPHEYLVHPLGKGPHHFEIVIDNTLDEVPPCLTGSHAYSENTQTNWNGITGKFSLEALPDPWIRDIQVYPDVSSHTATIKLKVVSSKRTQTRFSCSIHSFNTRVRQHIRLRPGKVSLSPGEQTVETVADLGPRALLWSEFHPALYRIDANLGRDRISASFGMKDLKVEGRRLTLNGKKIFLRGTHDALVFPLTGCPPTDLKSWIAVLALEKAHGLNHIRFHSCAPPKAAFEAADRLGMIIQAELPVWGSINPGDTAFCDYMKREGRMLLDYVGNSPSFGMLGLGNELGGSIPEMRAWLDEFRAQDTRHLYDFGSNNFLGWKGQQEGEDLLITCRTDNPDASFSVLRSSFSFADEDDGGPINAQRPRTDRDFSKTVAAARLPVIGHETGQFQAYPDYSQIERYTGVLHPYNLETFRRRLMDAGLADQAAEFARESAAFSLECYKEDIEWFLRTPGMAGFEMLDIKDYPGQGTALVGILDALMGSKGVVRPEEFRAFCSPLVPMALFDDFCRKTSKPLELKFVVANYTEHEWDEPLEWKLSDSRGWTISGIEDGEPLPQGEVSPAGEASIDLSEITTARALTLTLSTGGYTNSYHLWAFPDAEISLEGITTASRITPAVAEKLESGGKVLLVPSHDSITEASVGGLFTPDYWNFSMFKGISESIHRPVSPGTLCLLPDLSSPLFSEEGGFPTLGHSDWQWWSIAKNSRPIILDGLDGCRPLLQVVDNMERCHRLGILTEFKTGNGGVLLCSCDLDAIRDTPEGSWFTAALMDYMRSEAFAPRYEITAERLCAILEGSTGIWNESAVDTAADYRVKD